MLLPAVAEPSAAQRLETPSLNLEDKIVLGAVKGRIDHMAFDPLQSRLFVAELENNSLKRALVYASCGGGFIDILNARDRDYRRLARLPTVRGARTSYYVPSIDRLFLAVRSTSTEPAAVWVYRPVP
jgi:hypothetical protein